MRLEPVAPTHLPALFAATPRETFTHFAHWPDPWTEESFGAWLTRYHAPPQNHVYVVVMQNGGAVIGSTSYIEIDPAHRKLEVGRTWYAPAARGTVVNPECKLLLMRHAFADMGAARVTLRTDLRNVQSQAAIAKLGAVREGVLRRDWVRADGRTRDTVVFSVIAEEWPEVEARLRARVEGE